MTNPNPTPMTEPSLCVGRFRSAGVAAGNSFSLPSVAAFKKTGDWHSEFGLPAS